MYVSEVAEGVNYLKEFSPISFKEIGGPPLERNGPDSHHILQSTA